MQKCGQKQADTSTSQPSQSSHSASNSHHSEGNTATTTSTTSETKTPVQHHHLAPITEHGGRDKAAAAAGNVARDSGNAQQNLDITNSPDQSCLQSFVQHAERSRHTATAAVAAPATTAIGNAAAATTAAAAAAANGNVGSAAAAATNSTTATAAAPANGNAAAADVNMLPEQHDGGGLPPSAVHHDAHRHAMHGGSLKKKASPPTCTGEGCQTGVFMHTQMHAPLTSMCTADNNNNINTTAPASAGWPAAVASSAAAAQQPPAVPAVDTGWNVPGLDISAAAPESTVPSFMGTVNGDDAAAGEREAGYVSKEELQWEDLDKGMLAMMQHVLCTYHAVLREAPCCAPEVCMQHRSTAVR